MLTFKIWLNSFLEDYGLYSAHIKSLFVLIILADAALVIYLLWHWFFRIRALKRKFGELEVKKQFEKNINEGNKIVDDPESGLWIKMRRL